MRTLLGLAVGIGMCAANAWGAVPIFSTTLDDDASITTAGGGNTGLGTIQNVANHNYTPGVFGNAFRSSSSSTNAGGYANWSNAAVTTIFNNGGWSNTNGITVDLYFQGASWSGSSGSEGLWAMVRRDTASGGLGDTYFITQIINGKLRILFANDSNNQYKYTFDGTTETGTGVISALTPNTPLSNGVPYHLTVNLANSLLNVYLDDVNGNTYSNASPIFTTTLAASNYYWQLPSSVAVSGSPSGSPARQTREMDIGIRGFGNTGNTINNFGGTLKNGNWIDNVNVYNGVYVPEPATALLLLGMLPLLRRRR